MNPKIKVYSTRHGLTTGIEVIETTQDTYLADAKYYYGDRRYTKGIDLFNNKEEAEMQIEKMRLKEIQRLRKQIQKLENFQVIYR